MDFSWSQEQEAMRAAVLKRCAAFDDAYWLAKDSECSFPTEFHAAFAADGWLGIAMPQEVGGAGQGISEAAIMMQAITESGAGMSGASAIHMNIFGLNPVVVYGTAEQKARMLPPLISGQEKACFAVTEPDAGLDTTSLTTSARRDGDRYIVNGRKVWISTAQVADRMLLLARDSPVADASAGKGGKRGSKTTGFSLFYTALDRRYVEVREIPKMGRNAVDSNLLFINDLPVPAEDLIGAEGDGFSAILHGLNPERILIAAEAVGIGRAALKRASRYAAERVVFGRPIGKNQAIQHPLAECWMALEAAHLMTMKAAWLYDRGMPCGAEANAAKYLAAEAGYKACEVAVIVHGGYGYAKEYHVERYLREVMITKIAPISPALILSYIAERVLHLPKSY